MDSEDFKSDGYLSKLPKTTVAFKKNQNFFVYITIAALAFLYYRMKKPPTIIRKMLLFITKIFNMYILQKCCISTTNSEALKKLSK